MRISDWSSDVCSSDLFGHGARQRDEQQKSEDTRLDRQPTPQRNLLVPEHAREHDHTAIDAREQEERRLKRARQCRRIGFGHARSAESRVWTEVFSSCMFLWWP